MDEFYDNSPMGFSIEEIENRAIENAIQDYGAE